MLCPSCQNDAPAGSKFCNGCGARLDAACPQCGHGNPPGSRFCTECGQRLTAPSPSAPVAQSPSPQTYTPQHLAERILTSRAALEGERKQVTVLFADLKGSMELLADRDPEEARRILDPVLERMMEAVHRYEGTVNQVMGDGIMALFGAPLAHEDHAVRACYAALRMQAAVKQYARELQRTEGAFIQIRVGLNSGEVVVRSIGSDLHMDYTAVGQTTHLAARMEQLAAPGSILLAPDTLRLAEGYLHVKALGPMQVKGLGEPIGVYEALGAGLARSRLQAAAGRGFTKFVGRDAELETLRRTLEQAHAGHGQVVALVGEPGVGKSRLTWEFTHSHRAQDWLVLESGSISYGKATSYLPVIDLLKTYCGIESQDDHRRMRQKVLGKVLDLDRALELMVPPLLALLDVPVEDPGWEALDPMQRRARTLDAVKRLLLRESQEQPLLLVFEDLHWIDGESQTLLDSLVESLPTAPLLLLVNYRPEYEHTWHHKTYYQQLRLDPLAADSANELLVALLGNAPELEPLKRLLIERTEGNPFFVEESVRTLVESGVLIGERSSYRLAKPFESTQVPATVQAVLAARIDRLAVEDKRLLQAAAVVGKDVPYAILQAIGEVPEEALRQGLARLHAAEFLYETSLFPDLEYTFKHALTHEVAYGSLLQERRRALHARIVEAIEQLYPDRQAEHIERLAHHAVRGELWEQAAAYLRRAGQKAMARSAHREATAYFEEALGALDRLPGTRQQREEIIDTCFDLRGAVVPLGAAHRAVERLLRAETLAEALGDRRRLGWACAYLAGTLRPWERGVTSGHRALAIGEDLEDPDLQDVSSMWLGLAYLRLGDHHRAMACLARTVQSLQGARALERLGPAIPQLPAVASRTWLLGCLADLGEFREAIGHGEEALRIAEIADRAYGLSNACGGLGLVYLAKGDLENAIPILERGLAAAQAAQIHANPPAIAAALGYAFALCGRAAEAGPLLEQAERGWDRQQAMAVNRGDLLGMAFLAADKREAASEFASLALERARADHERGSEAGALQLLGAIAAQAERPEIDQAAGYYREALALAEELGMRPLAAHCHLGLGTLYRKIRRPEQAEAELTTAADMYRAMEMTFWLAKAEAALAQTAH